MGLSLVRIGLLAVLMLAAEAAAAAHSGNSGPALSDNTLAGRDIFNSHCVRCHASSRLGSPKLYDRDAWRDRLRQGKAALTEHAIDGHGLMPAKGGFRELSDEEVAAAVSYVVQQARAYAQHPRLSRSSACAESLDDAQCPPEERQRILIQRVLWLLDSATPK